jgi:thiol-disulfide isomerase/thioredoxin
MRTLVLIPLGIALVLAQPVSAADAPQKFALHAAPKPVPEIQFQDSEGNTLTLQDFRGKVVLLNIWATWCLPCRREMPTLDRLQAKLGGPDFEVLPLSIDRNGFEAITKFYSDVGVKHLAMYLDGSSQAASTLGAVGIPTTLLIDRDGRELGRLVGPAEWDSPDMIALIDTYLAKESGRLKPTLPRSAALTGNTEPPSPADFSRFRTNRGVHR